MFKPDIESRVDEGSLCDATQQMVSSLNSLKKALMPVVKDTIDLPANEWPAAEPSALPGRLPNGLPTITVQKQVVQLQQCFQVILAKLANANIDPDTEQRLRPYQTETHRLLRLLTVEAMRLRAAKQPETIEKGRSQLVDQLGKLQPFVQAIADEICEL